MNVRWITIKEGVPVIIKPDDFKRGAIFDLNAQQSFRDIGEHLNASEPAGYDPRHTSTTGILAIRPAA